jgi:hypothetical protein
MGYDCLSLHVDRKDPDSVDGISVGRESYVDRVAMFWQNDPWFEGADETQKGKITP